VRRGGSTRTRVARKKTTPPAGWQVVQDPRNEYSCWMPVGKLVSDKSDNRLLPTGERTDLRTFLVSGAGKLHTASVYSFHGVDPDAVTTESDLHRDCDTYLKAGNELLKVEVTSDIRTPATVGGVPGLKAVVERSRGPGEILYVARCAGHLFRFHQSIARPADTDGPEAVAFVEGIEILIR
jgi:hypothetical protein